MKWDNLINLKVGDIIRFESYTKNREILQGTINKIRKCSALKDTECMFAHRKCIGEIKINSDCFYYRCGIEDGLLIKDPLEDFFDEKEFEI